MPAPHALSRSTPHFLTAFPETCLKCLLLALLFFSFAPAWASDASQPLPVSAEQSRPAWILKSRQLVVVTAPDWESRSGTLRRYARTSDSTWLQTGEPVAVILGKGGQGWGLGLHPSEASLPDEPRKFEGDGKAPSGVFTLPYAFAYNPEQIAGTAMPVLDVESDLFCVDDPGSAHYNTIQRLPTGSTAPWNSAETMQRADHVYNLGVFVGHNSGQPEPGRGSCIFLHIRNPQGSPTAGCTAMSEHSLQELINWLTPAASPILVQLPEPAYARLRKAWGLP